MASWLEQQAIDRSPYFAPRSPLKKGCNAAPVGHCCSHRAFGQHAHCPACCPLPSLLRQEYKPADLRRVCFLTHCHCTGLLVGARTLVRAGRCVHRAITHPLPLQCFACYDLPAAEEALALVDRALTTRHVAATVRASTTALPHLCCTHVHACTAPISMLAFGSF